MLTLATAIVIRLFDLTALPRDANLPSAII